MNFTITDAVWIVKPWQFIQGRVLSTYQQRRRFSNRPGLRHKHIIYLLFNAIHKSLSWVEYETMTHCEFCDCETPSLSTMPISTDKRAYCITIKTYHWWRDYSRDLSHMSFSFCLVCNGGLIHIWEYPNHLLLFVTSDTSNPHIDNPDNFKL